MATHHTPGRTSKRRLADKHAFATLEVRHGVLTWLDGEVDIAPEGLYARSYEYPVPAYAGGLDAAGPTGAVSPRRTGDAPPRGMSPTCPILTPVAALVLLPGSARAGVVATHAHN